MTKFIDIFKSTFFWGLLFLLLLLIGFGVSFNDLWTEATTGHICIKIISIYLLISPILYIGSAITLLLIYGPYFGFFNQIGDEFIQNFFPIFMIFFIHKYDSKAYVIFRTVLWWGMTIFCVVAVCSVDGNSIIKAISSFETQEIWRRLGIFGLCCLGLFLIALALYLIAEKNVRDLISFWDE